MAALAMRIPWDGRRGRLFQTWGYVALAVDSLGPRGLANICGDAGKRGTLLFDGYAALHFLAQQMYVDPARIVMMGTSMGGHITLVTVEQGWLERLSDRKFRAAVALYPVCAGSSGVTTVRTLIVVGEKDDLTPADAYRNMAMGQRNCCSRAPNGDRSKLRLVVYPGVYHSFDNVKWIPGQRYLGHWIGVQCGGD